jgi:hypothetical protein
MTEETDKYVLQLREEHIGYDFPNYKIVAVNKGAEPLTWHGRKIWTIHSGPYKTYDESKQVLDKLEAT